MEYGTSPHWSALQAAVEPVRAAFDTGRTAAVAETTTAVSGTLLSKDGQHDYATRVTPAAPRYCEDLAEPKDWSVANQKVALTISYSVGAACRAKSGSPVQDRLSPRWFATMLARCSAPPR